MNLKSHYISTPKVNNFAEHLDKPSLNLTSNSNDEIDTIIKNIEGDDFNKMHYNLKNTLIKHSSKRKINHESAKKIKQKISRYMFNKTNEIPHRKPNKVDNHKAPAVKEVVVKLKHKRKNNTDNRVKNLRVIKHEELDNYKQQIMSDIKEDSSVEIMNFYPHKSKN